MRHRGTISRQKGFSLVEVLVALLVISVGLLGIAKMQALALSNTSSARLRSLAAIQAASLASSMHADRAYWANATPVSLPLLTASAANGVATSSTDANLLAALTAAAAFNPATDYCAQGALNSVAPCQPVQLAAADLQSWAADLFVLIPGSTATISCDANPLVCTITLAWRENLVAVNSKKTDVTNHINSSDAIQKSTYVLYVQP
jgi:type IV pilus assembly protein PilV